MIGVGRMGRLHRKVLRDLGYDVTTVDPDRAAAADHRSVPQRRFDVVCVSVPIPALAEQAAGWAGFAGHLLVEKPFAADAGEAAEVAGMLAGQRVAVGYVERFNPQTKRLREQLQDAGDAMTGRFVRWNDRPSRDLDLDLRSHDVDLAAWLQVPAPVFSTRAGSPVRRRDITVSCGSRTFRADLFAHDTSPLHAQWHHFLTGGSDCATPDDAVTTLRVLGRHGMRAAA